MQHLNMNTEADRRLTFEEWPVAFIDKNNLAEAGFYYTDHSDVVCCAFCVAQIGLWQEGDDVFKEHRRWSPNCEFIRCLSVGNFRVCSSDQPTVSYEQSSKSRDAGGYHLEYKPNSHPERCKYTCLFLFFSKCAAFIDPSLIFNVLFQLRIPEFISTQ
jgi:hypothetical protein